MERQGSRQIVIAGAGIAGLTAALAFARRGFAVQIYERAARLDEVGAGLQLSPNATSLLRELGVLDMLQRVAVRPEDVTLVDARTLKTLARVRLGAFAEERWGAPYLVVHRADLQSTLLAAVSRETEIRLVTTATVSDFATHAQGVTASIDHDGKIVEATARLLVGADGVWSTLRGLAGDMGKSSFSGNLAWRTTARADSPAGGILTRIANLRSVTVFVHPTAHFIVYPLRGGDALNIVGIAGGPASSGGWATPADPAALHASVADCAKDFRQLLAAVGNWTTWPIHTVSFDGPWTLGGFALIGDAAHAMTPFAAQGAAMAIEDAVTLADRVAGAPADNADALATWEKMRRARIDKALRRGALNRFAWHASGVTALARDLFLRTRSPEKLAADLDWLYGWKPERVGRSR